MVRMIAIIALLLVVMLGVWLRFVGQGGLGEHEEAGVFTHQSRPEEVITTRTAEIAAAAEGILVSQPEQILFGDLHVHTTFSFDAFMLSLPLQGGEGAHPPADACDFARFCSALDFWSINDHAEVLSQRKWRDTVETIRACNEVTGTGAEPDTVAFLGWEWTNVGSTPENHYGHKNVVLRDLEEGAIPTRPIGSLATRNRIMNGNAFGGIRGGIFLLASGDQRLHSLATLFSEQEKLGICPIGVPVRELPLDCLELVDTPDLLFDKLDDWNVESIVIPHGTTWGMYTPPGSDWKKQLKGALHDDDRQTLFEIYSGHGNSDQFRDYRSVLFDENGNVSCPEPTPNYLPSCWRAGEIVLERCLADGESQTTCDARAIVARKNAAEAGTQAHVTIAGVDAAEWLDAGQCRDCDQASFNYRPMGSAQYVTALSNFDTPTGEPRRFRFGFMASSDNHFGRPGTGYKELHRLGFTESRAGALDPDGDNLFLRTITPAREAPASESRAWNPETSELRGFALMEMERQASFFLTGGLTAVHSQDRRRESIWEAFKRREVYGTSGPRMLLWFDLLNPPQTHDGSIPMGGEVEMRESPSFQVRAVGSFEQQPGCPDYAVTALGAERLDHICKGECYHPSATRRSITRIEVVRIRPQSTANESIAALIEDPWRSFECDGSPEGCSVTFEDPEYASFGRDTVYYVRAMEASAPAINADGLRCERDATGNCIRVRPCGGGGADDNCLADHEPRAWSSPIFVDWPSS